MTLWWPMLLLFLPLLHGRAEARAETSADERAMAGVAEFKAAYAAWDHARFSAAAALFRQACTNAPNCNTHFYWVGVAEFHRMLQLQTLPPAPTNAVAEAAAMEAAIKALQTAVKLDPRHAETHALLGTLYGMKIDGNLVRAVRLGPRVQRHCAQALEHGADNPRVRYLLGMGQFHTARKPAARREALETLLAAEQLFQAEALRPAGPQEPRWGRSSCRTFIGRSYEALGQGAEAARYYRQALDEHPADHLAREGLARVTATQ